MLLSLEPVLVLSLGRMKMNSPPHLHLLFPVLLVLVRIPHHCGAMWKVVSRLESLTHMRQQNPQENQQLEE
jgi:hypothetical protein